MQLSSEIKEIKRKENKKFINYNIQIDVINGNDERVVDPLELICIYPTWIYVNCI